MSEKDSTGDRDTRNQFVYSTALEIGLTEEIGCLVEFFGDIPSSSNGGSANSFDGGFTFLMEENFQLDVSSGVGLSDDTEDCFIPTGFSTRFN